jgi:hypothetical protein
MSLRNLPAELQAYSRWVVWKSHPTKGKVPFDAAASNGSRMCAKADDPSTWTTFETALSVADVLSGNDYDGIGFMLHDTPLVGFDFDGCVQNETVEPFVLEILKQLGNPYCEFSPSGSGLHAIVEYPAALPAGKRKFLNKSKGKYGIEVYSGSEGGRYLTMTGDKFSGEGVPKIENIELVYLLASQINSEKFKTLWMGGSEAYANDQSSADMALMNLLARLTNNDRSKMGKYFGASVLGQREKWTDREDYRKRTLDAALKGKKSQTESGNVGDYTRVGGDRKTVQELVFHLPAVEFKFPRDYAIAPASGQKCGWFPSGGAPSILAGPSGAAKTTWMYQLLNTQKYGKHFHGHETYGYSFITFGRDRGRADHLETMERMQLNPELVPFVPLSSSVYDFDAAQEILNHIEATVPMPKIVFIEGIDMMVERGNDLRPTTDFMHLLHQISEHYNLVIIGSMGSPKVKEGNGYAATRDNILGSTGWGRAASSVALLQFSKKKEKGRRILTVELRNAPAEKFVLLFVDGELEVQPDHPDEEEASNEQAQLSQYLDWYENQAHLANTNPNTKWWTVMDVEHGVHVAHSTAERNVKEHYTKGYIIKKTTFKQGVRGQAIEYRWNEKASNPIIAERQTHQQEEPEVVL